MMVASDYFCQISIKKCPSHIDSYDAFDNAMYSSSAIDNDTSDCFLLFQLMAIPLITQLYTLHPTGVATDFGFSIENVFSNSIILCIYKDHYLIV